MLLEMLRESCGNCKYFKSGSAINVFLQTHILQLCNLCNLCYHEDYAVSTKQLTKIPIGQVYHNRRNTVQHFYYIDYISQFLVLFIFSIFASLLPLHLPGPNHFPPATSITWLDEPEVMASHQHEVWPEHLLTTCLTEISCKHDIIWSIYIISCFLHVGLAWASYG